MADFGLASVLRGLSSALVTKVQGCSYRYAAPEIHLSGDRSSQEADVFTFGMVVVEVSCCITLSLVSDVERYVFFLTPSKVFTGKYPFSEFSSTFAAAKIMDGERPGRPQEPSLTDVMWDMTCSCWCQGPSERPAMTKVVGILREWPVSPLLAEPSS